MKHKLAIALLLGCGALLGAAGDEFKSPSAREAKKKYETTLAKLQIDFDIQRIHAQDAYLAELNAALKQALKNEQLDEANRIKAEIDVMRAQSATLSPGSGNRISGVWDVYWVGGGRGTYRFGADVDFRGVWNGIGKIQSASTNEMVAFFDRGGENSEVHRFTIVGRRLFVEAFVRPPQLGDAPKSMAVGVPSKLSTSGH